MRLLFKCLLYNQFDCTANVRHFLDGLRRLHQVHHRYGYRRLALKGYASGQHLIKDHADGIQIARRRRLHALGLLGREIMHGAHDVAVGGERLGVRNARDAKVADLDLTAS